MLHRCRGCVTISNYKPNSNSLEFTPHMVKKTLDECEFWYFKNGCSNFSRFLPKVTLISISNLHKFLFGGGGGGGGGAGSDLGGGGGLRGLKPPPPS